MPTATATVVPPGPLPPTPPPTATGPTTPPGFFGTWSGVASGCANFTVFAADTSSPRYLVIKANKSELGLAGIGSSAQVNLASTSSAPSTEVGIDLYASAPAEPYCTDVAHPMQPVIFHGGAVSGTVTFTVSSTGRDDGTYALTVALSHVVVASQYGDLETIPDITYVNVAVGWFPG